MKSKLLHIMIRSILVTAAMLVISSCNQFHNENDWPMNKGAQPVYVPKEVSHNAR